MITTAMMTAAVIATALALAATAMAPPQLDDTWAGDFVVTIRGNGKKQGIKPAWAEWSMDREARGTIAFDRRFKGGGIARTPDSSNLDRYETWVGDAGGPVEMRVNDKVVYYGPLFEPRNIRLDTTIVQCPPMPSLQRPAG